MNFMQILGPHSKIPTDRCDPISYIKNGTRNFIFPYPVNE